MMGHIAQLTGTLNAESKTCVYKDKSSIATVSFSFPSAETPLSSEINLFVTFITTFAVTIGVIFFILAVAKGSTFPNALIYLIGIITANVPEGLLPTLTVRESDIQMRWQNCEICLTYLRCASLWLPNA